MTFKFCVLLLVGTLQLVPAEQIPIKEKSPYVELILCPTTEHPWECARQQTARLFNLWNIDLLTQWNDLKVEADQQMNKTLGRRGFSTKEELKEQPSAILNKIELGVNYIRDFVETTTNQLLGRQEEYDLPDNSEEEDKERQTFVGGAIASDNELRKKKKPLQDISSVLQQQQQHVDFTDLLQGLDAGLSGHGNKLGIKFPHKYGRSVGVQRGKKKKKKKILMKLMLLATLVKGKIELLLKVLSAHLQIKFFAIALIGLLINIARFWLDLKKGQQPQKVIYYEHAHHQHHYDDHGEDYGGEQSGYWKRSLESVETPLRRSETARSLSSSFDSGNSNDYKDDSQTMAYRRQKPFLGQ